MITASKLTKNNLFNQNFDLIKSNNHSALL